MKENKQEWELIKDIYEKQLLKIDELLDTNYIAIDEYTKFPIESGKADYSNWDCILINHRLKRFISYDNGSNLDELKNTILNPETNLSWDDIETSFINQCNYNGILVTQDNTSLFIMYLKDKFESPKPIKK
jgi:hypothetical protein